ncbi:hypothetical protein EGW08_012794 [Elysia chlorotica]|uniref:Peptidase M14 domain-containing protein n=1 Tax=Elysia chlorotica TaxID=188477 RepID=A0A3S0ZJY8_ELYCH|nr:hypothetical protein EGW08_012794 [Elysia chlorotica]
MQQKLDGATKCSLLVPWSFLLLFRVADVSHPALKAVVISIYILAQVCPTAAFVENPSRAQVVRITATSDADLNFVRHVKHKFNLDAWRDVHQTNGSGDFFVPSHHIQVIRNLLKLHGIPFTILVDDPMRFISEHEKREVKLRLSRAVKRDNFRYKYLSYNQIHDFLESVQKKTSQANVYIDVIGKSFEGRDTPYVKITGKSHPRPKGTIFIDGGIHSREWISPAMAIEVIHRLALNTEQDPQVDQLLDMFDFIVVPLVNPDGYAYTFRPGENGGSTRMWRKSRSSNYSSHYSCYGVDLNRNFGYEWNDNPSYGGSSDPCSPSFSGPFSFSEPESQNLRRLLLSNKDDIKGYLSFHSYGQYMLYPWGYRQDVEIEDEHDLFHVAKVFRDVMLKNNYDYHVGGSAKSLYPAAGGSSDYVKGVIGVKYSYTLELPPVEGSTPYGFIIPEREVETIVTDTWKGIKALLFRLHYHTADRTEKLQTIAHQMEKRLRTSVNDNISESKAVTENMLIPDSDMVPKVNEGQFFKSGLLNIFGFEDITEDNMTQHNKMSGKSLYNKPMKENVIFDMGTRDKDKIDIMRSGSAKLWSIGDALRNQYKYFNSNFRN